MSPRSVVAVGGGGGMQLAILDKLESSNVN
jgi:hypothetical protein